jgi:hypothetical protein
MGRFIGIVGPRATGSRLNAYNESINVILVLVARLINLGPFDSRAVPSNAMIAIGVLVIRSTIRWSTPALCASDTPSWPASCSTIISVAM